MANNVVTISGMFGEGHTYFANSPVVIEMSGLEWPSDSPFNILKVAVGGLHTPSIDAIEELKRMFPNSHAPLYSESLGYISSTNLIPIEDKYGVTHNVLFAATYTNADNKTRLVQPPFSPLVVFEYWRRMTVEEMLAADAENFNWIIETESSIQRQYKLRELAKEAYMGMADGKEAATKYTFHMDTGGASAIPIDISSALRAVWIGYDFMAEVAMANTVVATDTVQHAYRPMTRYFLNVSTEYLSSDDGGVYTTTQYKDKDGNTDIPGGQCLIGGWTEWERYQISDDTKRDVSALEHTGVRYGDASTKPVSSPERVGKDSITSWVDVQEGFTRSIFYPASATPEEDDAIGRTAGWMGHAPLVLRDSVEYHDFLFVNRRGAVETCSGRMLEDMNIEVSTTQYSRTERPAFRPSRSLMAIASGGRRSWGMSSGHVTREWAEWWTLEFLMARQWWMLYQGQYVPVIVTPAKKSVGIYDRSKQQMQHVDFTVTLALEG